MARFSWLTWYTLLHKLSFHILISPLVFMLVIATAASKELGSKKDVVYMIDSSANAVRRQGIDSSLERYSLMALSDASPGVIYNVTLSPSLDGIIAQAVMLPFSSLKGQGFAFNEFTIPADVDLDLDNVTSTMVLVYRKISNFTVYTLPQGYDFVAPVVGVIPYTLCSGTCQNSMLLKDSLSFASPVLIRMSVDGSIAYGAPLCAFFNANGSITLGNVTSFPNVCQSTTLGDVALVLPSSQEATQAATHPSLSSPVINWPLNVRKISHSWRMAVGATVGVIAGVTLLSVVALGFRIVQRIRIALMERFGDNKETLPLTYIGLTRAPSAVSSRTRPTLETEKFSPNTHPDFKGKMPS